MRRWIGQREASHPPAKFASTEQRADDEHLMVHRSAEAPLLEDRLIEKRNAGIHQSRTWNWIEEEPERALRASERVKSGAAGPLGSSPSNSGPRSFGPLRAASQAKA
jgi:hypothetical protein